jgi:hypothetical protein
VTEEEWNTCFGPEEMLAELALRSDRRKARLFAHACCRRMQIHIQAPELTNHFLGLLDDFADGGLSYFRTETVVLEFWMKSGLRWRGRGDPVFEVAGALDALWPVMQLDVVLLQVRLVAVRLAILDELSRRERRLWFWQRWPMLSAEECDRIRVQATGNELTAQTALIREIFDNPFQPVALDPMWLTSDVLSLARGIYDERAFDRMPILADALQDAGCDNDDVLNHCRDANQVHVRGCWVVDLLLGKE